ncbi:hypothetical protein [Halobacteriovorax sp.]|uniref:hypothetical protein n=1 Tax=Halobacteriovorax sp. TaxID=2020862 RepID=UPI003AF293DE
MKFKDKYSITLLFLFSSLIFAQDKNEVQDMSDPLAVYTQAGIGTTLEKMLLKMIQVLIVGSLSMELMHL